MCQGWAIRFVQLSDGRRQILSVLLPGDLFSTTSFCREKLHFSVQAVTNVRFSRFERADLKKRVVASTDILSALAMVCAAEQQDMDELSTALGRGTAEERIAHLIVRLVDRLSTHSGIGPDHRYPFPLRQTHIADITGLTSVHVSRVISEFRRANYLQLSKGFLVLRDRTALQRIGRLQ